MPLHVLVAAALLWLYRRDYPDLRWDANWSTFWPAVAIGGVVFALWMALEPAAISWELAKDGRGPRRNCLALGRGLAFLPGGRLGHRGAARRGAGLPRLPDPAPDRRRVHRRRLRAGSPGSLSSISSALFGALHGRWLAGTLAGLLYALALYRRRELADAVVAHATTNALIAANVLATGSWSLWA